MSHPAAPVLTVRAVLFDMDGTLVDSTAIVEQVWLEFAERYGLDYNEILRTSTVSKPAIPCAAMRPQEPTLQR
ncbi:beta-phosphoglucomutase-like phosphatase (HAD superfamily) [Arthrobacter bambusae]|uniref:Beta-phosphoglucomutase-like phosphatase (HAD superfamily) n=1 Tax=Arthrobacter bambusae TaxID=1338426 RepID=A0ABV2PC72_9MICC